MKTTAPKKSKPAAAPKVKAPAKTTQCIALDVGHRSCPCPDCSYNAPKK